MGDHEDPAKLNGFVPNGLRPTEAVSVTKVLDPERWATVEERTKELITQIQPNKPSEERRIAVANYVQQLIMKCFPCQVFKFGSVPLKTYLPDGDIDLTVFSKNLDLKDTWANQVREVMENEGKNEDAEFYVKEVLYIKAEVKIIKCLVENIVVDISFNQLGGLCTLCFLEEIDNLINNDHLFKRSIILIKAWCYYESRILGAHHGLFSTYALETLVLYIFHVFNNSFAGPLEVLYRFLEFFSKFDWENFCVSLWGPVPTRSLPNTAADPPRKDTGDLLLSQKFLYACSAVYSVFPSGQDTQGQSFISKHFNVIDPLRTNNNLGRSVSKGNFYRICSAFAFGAKRLSGLLECPKGDLIAEIDKFFINTWRRHGSGNRPDAPTPVPLQLLAPNSPNSNQDLEGRKSITYVKKKTENVGSRSVHHASMDVPSSFCVASSQPVTANKQNPETISLEGRSSGFQSQKNYGHETIYEVPDQFTRSARSSETVCADKFQSNSRLAYLSHDHAGQGKMQFARTHSSPELSDTSAEILSHARQNNEHDIGKNNHIHVNPNIDSRKNFKPDTLRGQKARFVNGSASPKYNSFRSQKSSMDSNGLLDNFHDSASISSAGEEIASQSLEMNQEEQDLINMRATPRINGLVQPFHLPINFSSHQFSSPFHMLPAIGYSYKNVGVIPANVPVSSWTCFPQSLMPPSVPDYFSNTQLDITEEAVESGNDSSSLTDLNQEDVDQRFWSEQESQSSVPYIPPDTNFQVHSPIEKNVHPFGEYKFFPFPQASNHNVPFAREHARIYREKINLERGTHNDATVNDANFAERSTDTRFSRASQASSSRNVVADALNGIPSKKSTFIRDRHGREPGMTTLSSKTYGNANSRWHHKDSSVDPGQVSRDDVREWVSQSSLSNEISDKNVDSLSAVPGSPPSSGPDVTLVSGSESIFPAPPMVVCAPHQQRSGSSSGPYTHFFPPGHLVSYVMVPVYEIPSDSGVSDGSREQFNGMDANQSNSSVRDFDLNEKYGNVESISTSTMENDTSESIKGHKFDILNSDDFCSHWQNLQYGRLCQDTNVPGPPIYPNSVPPPMYFQSYHPWDSPARSFCANTNVVPLISYGPRPLEVMHLPPGTVGHNEVYQRYGDEVPSFRGGTGTFLPKAKIPFRDRSSNTRNHRSSYNYDRSDHGDREGSWIATKSRFQSRGHGRAALHDKHRARPDRLPAVDTRNDRSWGSHKKERISSSHRSNASSSSSSSTHGPENVTHGMYPTLSLSSDIHQSRSPVQPFVMLYPYSHPSLGYGSSSEPVEFGSPGRMYSSDMIETQSSSNGFVPRSPLEYRQSSYHRQGSDCSSPDQPSSPHIQR